MSCFDTLRIACPRCGASVDFLSRAGDCGLKTYTIGDVPADIAGDLDGDSAVCNCGAVVRIRTHAIVSVYEYAGRSSR